MEQGRLVASVVSSPSGRLSQLGTTLSIVEKMPQTVSGALGV